MRPHSCVKTPRLAQTSRAVEKHASRRESLSASRSPLAAYCANSHGRRRLVAFPHLVFSFFFFFASARVDLPARALTRFSRHARSFFVNPQGSPGAASAFYAVLLAEALAAMPRVTAQAVPRLLPYLEAGLAPAASAEQYAGALMVATQLASRAPLAPPLTEALLEGVAKGARAPLHAQALQASLALCQTQAVKALPGRAFKHLVKLPDLPGHFADLCRGYRADALAVPLVEALARSAGTHANYERVLAGVVASAPLSGAAVAALAGALVAAARAPPRTTPRSTRSGRWSRASRQPHPPRWTLSSPSPPRRHPRPRRRKAPRAPPPSFCARRWRARRRARCPATPPRSARRLTTRARVCARRRSASSARAASAARSRMVRMVRSPEPCFAAWWMTTRASRRRRRRSRACAPPWTTTTRCSRRRRSASRRRRRRARGSTRTRRASARWRSGASRWRAPRSPRRSRRASPARRARAAARTTRRATRRRGRSAAAAAAAAAARASARSRGVAPRLRSATSRFPLRRARWRARRSTPRAGTGTPRSPACAASGSGGRWSAPTRPSGANRRTEKDKNSKSAKSADRGGPVVDKETRALMDAAANRAVVEALAEGLASGPGAWEGEEALTLWTRDAWRVGSPRARATLLLALRRAAENRAGDDSDSEPSDLGEDDRSNKEVRVSASGVAAARRALWTLVKEEWFGEHGGGAFLDADAPFELPGAADFKRGGVGARANTFELDVLRDVKASTFRAIAKQDARVVAALARSAARAVCSFDSGKEVRSAPSSASAPAPFDAAAAAREAFDVVAASLARSGPGACATRRSLEATVESILRALGEDAAAFLAAKAACDPEAGDPNAELPRVALELLASRGGGGGARKGSPDASTLAALVAACCASDPATRAAAARAVAALAPAAGKKKPAAKAARAGGGDVSAVWAALAAAGDVVGDAGASTASARAATSAALAEGLRGDEDGAATRGVLAPAVAFAETETETETEPEVRSGSPRAARRAWWRRCAARARTPSRRRRSRRRWSARARENLGGRRRRGPFRPRNQRARLRPRRVVRRDPRDVHAGVRRGGRGRARVARLRQGLRGARRRRRARAGARRGDGAADARLRRRAGPGAPPVGDARVVRRRRRRPGRGRARGGARRRRRARRPRGGYPRAARGGDRGGAGGFR